MAAALVQVCVDPRLNHDLIRIQVRQRLQAMGLSANRIYILNEVGGNLGANFGTTVDLLASQHEPIVLCAVLHHDGCVAAQGGVRKPLESSAQQMTARLLQSGVHCPVLTGTILTEHNHLLWTDERQPRHRPWTFRAH